MRMAERKFKDSFREAGAGIWYCVVSQRNMKIHLLATIIVLIASWLLGLNPVEFALVIFAITLVLVAEMFNTAVEKTIDLYVKTYHPGARMAKHVAAGAVLVAAINSVVIGVIVFGPHLYSLLFI
ncbi:MAG TPA: diacylglycerol kinase [Peptococcaceae bacterium]|nr:diacylglycerol kinase [Peptococcaceae bacterium]HBI27220.1 diacylglycerol kinase [Peptococcaceae bacterium]